MKIRLVSVRRNLIPIVVVSTAFITNLSLTVFNGVGTCVGGICGMYIGNLHYHDFLWHFALAKNAFESIPFILPIYKGATLSGYNYLVDIILFLFDKIRISVFTSYFLVLPIIYLILTAYFGWIYLKRKKNDKLFIATGLFFIFFGSSFSYVLSLYHFHTWRSFMYAQAMQSGRALLNMPYALSLPVMLASMVLLQIKHLSKKHMILLGVFLFMMFGLKFYGGIVLFVLIVSSRAFILIKKGKYGVGEFSIYLAACVVAYFAFYKTNFSSFEIPFTFSPLSIAHPMIEEKDMFYLPSLVLARYTLVANGLFSPRLIAIELFTAGLFLFYNLGSRVLGFLHIVRNLYKRKMTELDIALIITIFISTLITLLFIQRREWWNIIQFMGYALFLMNFFAAEALFYLLKSKNRLSIVAGVVFVLLTLPSNIEQINFARERHVSFTNHELTALEFLKKQPQGTVLALPYQETSYVSAFGEKQQFIADKTQLYLLGIDYEKRLNGVKDIGKLTFDRNHVSYIYYKKNNTIDSSLNLPKGYVSIFQNQEVTIYFRR
ncbi:MAG: hypothetical protein WC489_01845 [Patescibacteria group bacterium]